MASRRSSKLRHFIPLWILATALPLASSSSAPGNPECCSTLSSGNMTLGRVQEFESEEQRALGDSPPPSVQSNQSTAQPSTARVSPVPKEGERIKVHMAQGHLEFGAKNQADQVRSFLDAYTSFPGPDRCGHWAKTYTSLHSRWRKLQSGKTKYLMFMGTAGLGDRIHGLLASFVISLLTSRVLLVGDSILPHAFEPAEIDWTVPGFLKKHQHFRGFEGSWSKKHYWGMKDLSKSNRSQESAFVRFWTPVDPGIPVHKLVEAFAPLTNIRTIRFSSNHGILAQLLSAKGRTSHTGKLLTSLGLQEDTAHACILRYLVRPKKQVLSALLPRVLKVHPPRSASICIHARFRDDQSWGKGGQLKASSMQENDQKRLTQALECASKLSSSLNSSSATSADRKWFLLSNLPGALAEAKKQFPGNVVESPRKPRHMAYDKDKAGSTREAVEDWLLFSLCSHFVPSNSGFSKTAIAYSMSRKSVVKTDRYYKNIRTTPYHGPHCDPTKTLSMEDLGGTGSGL